LMDDHMLPPRALCPLPSGRSRRCRSRPDGATAHVVFPGHTSFQARCGPPRSMPSRFARPRRRSRHSRPHDVRSPATGVNATARVSSRARARPRPRTGLELRARPDRAPIAAVVDVQLAAPSPYAPVRKGVLGRDFVGRAASADVSLLGLACRVASRAPGSARIARRCPPSRLHWCPTRLAAPLARWRAGQKPLATTAMRCRRPPAAQVDVSTPAIALARTASKRATLALNTGGWSITAVRKPGSATSMPNFCGRLISRESRRLVACR